jgi:membrane protease YdiL (CAAX protease family)
MGILLAAGSPNSLFVALGGFGPAIAGTLLSRGGVRTRSIAIRPIWFVVFFVISVALIYVGTTSLLNIELPPGTGLMVLESDAFSAVLPAWILSGAFSSDRGVRQFLRTLVFPQGWFWQVVSVLCYPACILLAVLLARVFGSAIRPPRGLPSSDHRSLIFGVTMVAIAFISNGVGEEPGWRGYLLPRLQREMSPLRASLAVWFCWALWHLPSDILGHVTRSPESYLSTRFAMLLPTTVIMTWLYNRSGQSIMSVALFHATINGSLYFLPSTSITTWLLCVWACILMFVDRMWRFESDRSSRVATTLGGS